MDALGLLFHLLLQSLLVVHEEINFKYNGFLNGNLTLKGVSFIKFDGMLVLTNDSARLLGHAFYPSPVQFKKSNPDNNGTAEAATFSTNFVFSITSKYPDIGGHGLAFVLVPTKKPNTSNANQYLGLPNDTSIGRFLAVEFDIIQNPELQDINDIDNHERETLFGHGLTMITTRYEYMYVGFSASTGLLTALHYVHGWSFSTEGRAQDLDPRKLPFIKTVSNKVVHSKGFAIGMTLISVTLVFLMIIGAINIIFRIRDGDEILEDWEIEYVACRFKYSNLFAAARGFGERNLIGSGGSGRVYKGVIPSIGLEVAIKQKVVHRDVKPSNVLIYEVLNAKLGDFGLGRTYEHNNNPQTTNIVGTLGYLAPELTRTGKATTSTDVYGYGTLMLEVSSRRRPIEPKTSATELVLVDWVRELYSEGEITRAIDPKLDNYHSGEAQLALTLGLLCCHPHPDYRPTMRRVVLLLGDATLPPLPHDSIRVFRLLR
ncbi:NAC domain protein [Hibiscus syriacus]|uniref:NAC domain protein n=1 Tax=Hibiscus syriacus TaxID=106335 RepID=A0A6A2YFX6_HIBSY|nr:NAC domain protein [Hibiscus syriacus]